MEELVYEYIEEADNVRLMELLDAVVNRFRELHDREELILLTLPVGDSRARAQQLEQAVEIADGLAKEGDAVFFSPASASFDMYKNFEERGKHFKALVTALSE